MHNPTRLDSADLERQLADAIQAVIRLRTACLSLLLFALGELGWILYAGVE